MCNMLLCKKHKHSCFLKKKKKNQGGKCSTFRKIVTFRGKRRPGGRWAKHTKWTLKCLLWRKVISSYAAGMNQCSLTINSCQRLKPRARSNQVSRTNHQLAGIWGTGSMLTHSKKMHFRTRSWKTKAEETAQWANTRIRVRMSRTHAKPAQQCTPRSPVIAVGLVNADRKIFGSSWAGQSGIHSGKQQRELSQIR